MTVTLFDGQYDAFAALMEQSVPRGRTGAQLAADDAAKADRTPRRWIAWEDGAPIAAADLTLRPDGGHQIGFYGPWDGDRARALLAAVEVDARSSGVGAIRVGASGAAGCVWCRDNGFALAEEGIHFVRTLADYDPDAHSAPVPDGLTLTSLAERADDPECDRKVYALDLALRRDVPGDEAWSWSFEDFCNNHRSDSGFDADLYLILEAGDGSYVGLHRIWVNPDGPRIGMTGVLPTWRGRGAGQALKAEGLRRLKARGFARVTTDNDATNTPILRLNARFGFVEDGRSSTWSKTLSSGDTVRCKP